MSGGGTVLDLPWPIDLRLTVMSHGWAHLEPWSWDADEGRLSRCERIGVRRGVVSMTQPDLRRIEIRSDGFGEGDAPAVVACVCRWLSADWEPGPALAALGEAGGLIAQGGGRILRCSTFYEDFVKTILTINTAWSSTCRMAAALVAEPGGGVFPPPEAILEYDEARLRERAKLGFRAATVVGATRRLLEDGAIDAAGDGDPDHDYLIGIKGIGPYAAAHCSMLLHDFARLPVDSALTSYLRREHGCDPTAFAESRAHWQPYLGLGYRLMRLQEKLAVAAM
jgi:3-methyladenine DNA glycosylase/8-oxoguanine DNA glycosylase